MITNNWKCNKCAKTIETDGEMRPTAPNNPPRTCPFCGQSTVGFHHLGSFIDGRQILSTTISERTIPPGEK